MILTLRPGEKFEVPVGADIPILFGTPFTEEQLVAGELTVIWTHAGETGSWPAEPEGEGILLNITADMLETGFYALKPRAVIDGEVKKYTKAIGMRVLADGEVL